MAALTRHYFVCFDGDEGLVTDHGGGFDLAMVDEDTAIELFRLWYRRKRDEAERERLAQLRRGRLHLVQGGNRNGRL